MVRSCSLARRYKRLVPGQINALTSVAGGRTAVLKEGPSTRPGSGKCRKNTGLILEDKRDMSEMELSGAISACKV